jgi:hypothetical protein
MKKLIFWIGLVLFVLGIFLLFISGSSSGPELKPTIPFLYGTNQIYWMIIGVAGFVVMLFGIFLKKSK